jgi:hypothetical protein
MLKARLLLIRFVALVVAVLIFSSTVPAQERSTFELGLLATYQEKPQILQGFYCGKKLKFDADANLLDGGALGPWTVCGEIHIRDILVKQSETVIKAHRIYLFYDSKKNSFLDVDLAIPKKDRHDKERWEKRQLEIRIAHPKNADEAGIRATLAKLLRNADKRFFRSCSRLLEVLSAGPEDQQNNRGASQSRTTSCCETWNAIWRIVQRQQATTPSAHS